MIELFGNNVSVYCAKVRLVLELKGLGYQMIEPEGGYSSAAYRKIAPSGTIPAIRKGSFFLHDSDAIVNYLEDRYPQPIMRPENIEQRAQLNAIANFHDTKAEPTLRQAYALVSQPAIEREEAVLALKEKLTDCLTRIEALIEPAPFLGGETISLADCGYPVTLAYIEHIMLIFNHRVIMPSKVGQWHDALKSDPVVSRILNQYMDAFSAWLASRLVS